MSCLQSGTLTQTGLARKTCPVGRSEHRSCLNMIYPNTGMRVAALNLEILSRGLAAIGDLFVFDRLSFVEGRKTSLLHRRNMNEHVLAARRGLDETIPLGRVEPFDRTFSHPSSPRDHRFQGEEPVPANRRIHTSRIRRIRRAW